MILPVLFIAPSDFRGRGVYTSEPIPKGTVIEIAPVLVLSKDERAAVETTSLYNYIFEWDDAGGACVALGYVSIYNHSYHSNCEYDMDYESQLITIRTVRPVAKGEELFINYNADADNETPVWFEAN
ncbi:SET domain-containing protein [Sediminibacterium roseum]|uniref:SET domain-containing protein n=1 Tax=Sediminibacterium roseum TaxID=1978412 RepID=A0ABX0A1L8_9BACT|nr:SET domain-containing protein [Sediminibacterium roseum]NCI51110.1 SET domain-containing protein [Sediminibacterium roseum]